MNITKKQKIFIGILAILILYLLLTKTNLLTNITAINNINNDDDNEDDNDNDSGNGNGNNSQIILSNNKNNFQDITSLTIDNRLATNGSVKDNILYALFSEINTSDITIGKQNHSMFIIDGLNSPAIITPKTMKFQNGKQFGPLINGYDFSKVIILFKIEEFNNTNEYGVIFSNEIFEIRVYNINNNNNEIHIIYKGGNENYVCKINEKDFITLDNYYVIQIEFEF